MELKYMFVWPVRMSQRSNELWEQGCFTVTGNSLCVAVHYNPLNAHKNIFNFTVARG